MTIVYFIIALGVLVFIHEFGHFLLAKKQGIGVEKFSLGFGPKIFGFKKGETTYLISALPLGGYVKLRGEEADQNSEAARSDPTSYAARPVGHRLRVVFAGPAMNLVLALVLMPLIFMLGRPEPAFWQEPPVIVGIKKGSPAEQAGLQVGQTILKVGGEEVSAWKEVLNEIVLEGGKQVSLTVSGKGEITLPVAQDEATGGGMIGIEPYLVVGQEAIVDGVVPGSVASLIGLKIGDEILRINGEEVGDWQGMAAKIDASGGQPIKIEIKREGGPLTLMGRSRFDTEAKRWVLGVQKDFEKRGGATVVRRYGFFPAIALGLQEDYKLAKLTLTVVGRLLTFRLSYKSLGGPVRIAQASAAAAKSGLANFLYFLAFLSLQLGILNLLPIPVLDGGHLLFLGVERLSRRPVSPRVRQGAEQVGFVLLVSLMVLVTLHDVDTVWGFKSLLDRVRGLF